MTLNEHRGGLANVMRQGSDKRRQKRRAISKLCWIDVGPDQDPIECCIENISNAGALLSSEQADQIPDEFGLYFTRDGNVGRKCKVVRRNGTTQIALFFIARNIPKPKSPSGNMLNRMNRL